MVCQLRPFVNSLGLNNPPNFCLTPRKLSVKNWWRNKQGNCRCKMAGTGIRSFAKLRSQMPRIATTGITLWKTALKWTADGQTPRSGCQEYMRSSQACGNLLSNWYFCLWQSAVRLLYSWQFRVYQTPGIATIRGTHLNAELSKRLNASSCQFTSRVPLFEVSYLFAVRLLEYKIPTQRIVQA
jgi:hypothetical protein